MISRMWILWTCTVVIFLLVRECHCIQKTTLSKNWGPQSMLYLKGKHGRRFVPDIDDIISNSGLKSWYAVLKGFLKLKSLNARKQSGLFTTQNFVIR
ncbi:spexin prohormone 2-like [Megalobrama amblycephala]|uniref:spexin prohormone 2-like n=1 Tax=Megalobrama amblycephala TaxID=75352 RepID=UPI0020146C1B|nr:spexin prohormone 2-like [Megalobrama amblycephala]